MSNWSRVIVCWSGGDDHWMSLPSVVKSEDERRELERGEIQSRVDGMCESGSMYLIDISYPCPLHESEMNFAVECTVTFDVNHFCEDGLFVYLSGLEWTYPSEVQVFQKDEHMDRYRVCSMNRDKSFGEWVEL